MCCRGKGSKGISTESHNIEIYFRKSSFASMPGNPDLAVAREELSWGNGCEPLRV